MIIGMLLLYFFVLIIVGLITSKNFNSLEEYFLGGRKLSSYIMALSFSSTGMSGWLTLGFAGYTYENGFQSLWIMIPSITVGIIICYKMVSKRLRYYSEQIGAITVIELIKKRFYDNTNILTIITEIMICAATIAYVSGQLIASGKLLNIILHWNYQVSVFVTAIVMVVYTVLGGFIAVCWTDVIQGILMIVGSFLAGIFAWMYSGGFEKLSYELIQTSHSNPDFLITPFAGVGAIVMGMSLFIGDGIFNWVGQPTLMVKYMAAKDSKTLSQAAIINIIIQFVLFGGVFLASVYMRTQFPDASTLPYSGDTETVLIQFFITMTHPMIVGIIIAAIIAAIMSTSDSLLMMATSVLVNDIYNTLYPKASQKHLIFVSRITTILLGIISVIISLNKSSVLWSSWFGWTTLGIVGAPIVIGLYWKRATKEGAIVGILSGFIVLIVWNVFGLTQILNIFHGLSACGTAYIMTILVSLFTPKPPAHLMREIDDLKNRRNNLNKVELD